MRYTKPKGVKDFLPKEASLATWVENEFRETCSLFGFKEIRIPVLEHTELFLRSTGEGSDIVRKEMYAFKDKGGREIALRPEGTPGVIRAVIEGNLRRPARLFYIGPMFRYERPQKGRLREHHQLGVEVLGEKGPYIDAEIILLGSAFLSRLGLKGYEIAVNSLGCRVCSPVFKKQLSLFLAREKEGLCEECRERQFRNPLRVFDCKNPSCQEIYLAAPKIDEYLCPDCSAHFAGFLKYLAHLGIDNYRIENKLVRGIDYYTRTVFEFISLQLGAQNSFGGGGRYDYLVSDLGGENTPAIGFALGLERIFLILPSKEKEERLVFLAFLSEADYLSGKGIIEELREAKIPVIVGEVGEKLKTQLKWANSYDVQFVIIVGEEELRRRAFTIRDMRTGEQKEVKREELLPYLKELVLG